MPWIALFLAGIAVVVVVTLLVLGGSDGNDGGDSLILPPDDQPVAERPKRAPSKSASELLEGPNYGFTACGQGAFKKGNTSNPFCLAVAQAIRQNPQSRYLTGIRSSSTGELYDMECRPGNADQVLLKYRFCTEVGTTDPNGIGSGDDIAQVVARP